jgi:hypothetical protein
VPHEIVKATSASLASKKRQAEKKVEHASQLIAEAFLKLNRMTFLPGY